MAGVLNIKTGQTYLDAAISEINDEGCIEPKFYINNRTDLLYLKLNEKKSSVYIFLFEIPDSSIFFKYFPKEGRREPCIIKNSAGETDVVMSLSMENIIGRQNEEYRNNNNYFTSYFCNTFNKIIKPYFENESPTFKNKWSAIQLPYHNDVINRIPKEFPTERFKYEEQANKTYIFVNK